MIDDTIMVTFSQPLDRSTVDAESFVIHVDGAAVSGSRLFADGDSTVMFVPIDVFPPLSEISLDLDGIASMDGVIWNGESDTLPTWPSGYGVYPGDMDNNGVVEVEDLLQIPIYWHETGPQRDRYDSTWKLAEMDAAYGWPDADMTYADANGDGIVDEADLFPIGRHLGNSHPYAAPVDRLRDAELVDLYQSELRVLLRAIEGNNSAFMEQVRQYLQQLLKLEAEVMPTEFSVSQNFPNPFNPHTLITVRLPETENVSLQIYNTRGQLVRVLCDRVLDAGEHVFSWDGSDNRGEAVASGLYFYRVVAGTFQHTRKMMLLR
jgi:hypothetical protein